MRHSVVGGVSQTLHDVWPSPGLVQYIYIFGGLAPQRNFARCNIHFVSKSCILLYWQCYCTALKQWASAKLCGERRGRELPSFRSSFAPPVFHRAAIKLDIGPRFQFTLYTYCISVRNHLTGKLVKNLSVSGFRCLPLYLTCSKQTCEFLQHKWPADCTILHFLVFTTRV